MTAGRVGPSGQQVAGLLQMLIRPGIAEAGGASRRDVVFFGFNRGANAILCARFPWNGWAPVATHVKEKGVGTET